MKFFKGLLLLIIMNCYGCASYYSHYGSFSAQNSAGEDRLFVVSWRTAEYPSWAIQDNKATEITLEAQCSERKWLVTDSSSTESECVMLNEGVVACGDSELDLDLAGKTLPDDTQVCVSMTDRNGAKRAAELEKAILITVSCLPESATRKEDGKVINKDYLKASVVPYSVSTQKVERYSFNDKPPKMSDKICEIEE